MTLSKTLQTLFCELKSSLCIGLNVCQSSPVLWIEKQLWCCGAAELPVLCSLKQTKPNILEPTKLNKTNVGVYLLRKNDFIFHKNIFYIFSFCPVCLDDCGHCAANKQNVVCILRFRARCVSAGHWWRGPAALCGAGVKIFVVCTRRTMMCQHHWWPLTQNGRGGW